MTLRPCAGKSGNEGDTATVHIMVLLRHGCEYHVI